MCTFPFFIPLIRSLRYMCVVNSAEVSLYYIFHPENRIFDTFRINYRSELYRNVPNVTFLSHKNETDFRLRCQPCSVVASAVKINFYREHLFCARNWGMGCDPMSPTREMYLNRNVCIILICEEKILTNLEKRGFTCYSITNDEACT